MILRTEVLPPLSAKRLDDAGIIPIKDGKEKIYDVTIVKDSDGIHFYPTLVPGQITGKAPKSRLEGTGIEVTLMGAKAQLGHRGVDGTRPVMSIQGVSVTGTSWTLTVRARFWRKSTVWPPSR